MEKDEIVMLESSESIRISLEAIRTGQAGLNEHRKKLLERVAKSGDWAILCRDSITIKDIAYLSAATLHEFALLRGKREDVLFHGTARHCEFTGEVLQMLECKKLWLVAHTHSDRTKIVASAADREFLRKIGQEKSIIISYTTGKTEEFYSSLFREK